jgi:circadian clock protein KaiC
LADTWIQVSYLMRAGERNRALTIVKSRGTRHSDQIRELILTDRGATLAATYTVGGEILMGTARWQAEQDERAQRAHERASLQQRRIALQHDMRDIAARGETLRRELTARRDELALLSHDADTRESQWSTQRRELWRRRASGSEGQPARPAARPKPHARRHRTTPRQGARR